ncbi:MAG: serine/threonine protein kinase, partial [Proteobacteria bacterium]|nr:serine/threonine protein kinase [Pseudomonadota bacterium]
MSELRPDKSTAVSPEAHAASRGGTDAPAKASDAPALNLSAAQNAALATPAELADRYRVIRKLGSGTQGVVFLAERLSDHTKVAIKQLCIDSVKTWKEYTLFHREAEVLEGLDIPGVVKLYEACDYLDATPPCSYIVQEYIEGVTLKQALASGYRFSLDRAYALLLQLIDILEKLHTHEPPVIHRDIKPSNLILKNLETDQFQVFLIDFGAVANPKVQSGGSTVAGTFGYMSPEQMIGRATPQSDTYALAALFAYIISGVDPAEMKTQDLRLIIDPYVENHPVALVQTLRRMLEPDLENRLADLGELRRRFLSFKQGHYVLENENFQHFSKQDLITRLNAVKYLCQPQNLEIWQDLPDNPKNREAFPIRLQTHPRFYGYPVRHIQYNPYYEGGNSSTDDYGLLFIILYLITGLAGLVCL